MSHRFNPWYEIGHGPDPATGRHVRYYSIKCSRCNNPASFHANNLSDDGLRKVFLKKHWYISKRKTQHLCPECLQTNRVRTPPQPSLPLLPPSPPPPRLTQLDIAFDQLKIAWEHSTQEEKEAFEKKKHQNGGMFVPSMDAFAGQVEKPMAIPAVLIPTLSAPETPSDPPPQPQDNDEDVADWWLELDAKIAKRKQGK